MNINERFSSVLSSIEFQLARSLPIFNRGKEILFFYKTEEINKIEYKISEIRYVVFRDIEKEHIEVLKATDVIPQELINALTGSINRHTLSVDEELKAEDDFLELYEKIKGEVKPETYGSTELKRLSKLFLQLTEGTQLLPIYQCLGKDFCDLISSK